MVLNDITFRENIIFFTKNFLEVDFLIILFDINFLTAEFPSKYFFKYRNQAEKSDLCKMGQVLNS